MGSEALRIAYLHGFNSGPASIKGRLLGNAIAALPEAIRPEYFLPQLSHRPAEAIRTARRWADAGDRDQLTFVGSSLGGFYATHLAEAYGASAVLINPAIHPDRDLAPYVGAQRNPFTGEEYEPRPVTLPNSFASKVARIARPRLYLLLVQTGDEVLDYRVRSRSARARGSLCKAAAITRSRISRRRFR